MGNYASIGRRLIAYFLDGLILIVPCALAAHVLPVLGGVLIWFFYAPVLEASAIQGTLGKYLLGVQVTDLEGRRITLRTSLVRNLVKVISVVLLFLGFVVAFFSERRQTLHDLLAETIVVNGKSEEHIADAWMGEVRGLFQGRSGGPMATDDLAKLERLQSLREKGVLTEEEFLAEKRKILG